MTWQPPEGLHWGRLLVGNAEHALNPPDGVTFIVNAANVDYPWPEAIRRFWLNLNYKGTMGGVTWQNRLLSAVQMIIMALSLGGDVLIHCRQGKHRSGILNIIAQTVMHQSIGRWSDVFDACVRRYFETHPLATVEQSFQPIIRKSIERGQYRDHVVWHLLPHFMHQNSNLLQTLERSVGSTPRRPAPKTPPKTAPISQVQVPIFFPPPPAEVEGSRSKVPIFFPPPPAEVEGSRSKVQGQAPPQSKVEGSRSKVQGQAPPQSKKRPEQRVIVIDVPGSPEQDKAESEATLGCPARSSSAAASSSSTAAISSSAAASSSSAARRSGAATSIATSPPVRKAPKGTVGQEVQGPEPDVQGPSSSGAATSIAKSPAVKKAPMGTIGQIEVQGPRSTTTSTRAPPRIGQIEVQGPRSTVDLVLDARSRSRSRDRSPTREEEECDWGQPASEDELDETICRRAGNIGRWIVYKRAQAAAAAAAEAATADFDEPGRALQLLQPCVQYSAGQVAAAATAEAAAAAACATTELEHDESDDDAEVELESMSSSSSSSSDDDDRNPDRPTITRMWTCTACSSLNLRFDARCSSCAIPRQQVEWRGDWSCEEFGAKMATTCLRIGLRG